MNIQQIYQKFDSIGCLTFATVDEFNLPQTRIAHLRGYDDDGIYFMTMFTKDFYSQLKNNGKISVCGLNADSKITHDENGLPIFEGGYAIRMTGEVKEVSIEELKQKNNPMFDMCIKDYEKYNAMVVFCITKANGDIFDYDFEMVNRKNKLDRIYFAYNGGIIKYKGLEIDNEKCISCGICKSKCSFLAIQNENNIYSIDNARCDECGNCFISCPVKAINKF